MSRGIPAISDGGDQYQALKPIPLARSGDQEAFRESLLQELVDDTPELLPVREFYPHALGLASLGREIPVDLGNRQGFIDNLLVTNEGHFVLVETKLYRNPEALREVIAQTLQYGMALNTLPLNALEIQIRRGWPTSNSVLRPQETIMDRVRGMVERGAMPPLIEDFEEALERNTRMGEILFLIVSDGIHVSVERLAQWLNEYGGSSPFRFGLIELRFFTTPDNRKFVVPRSLARTKEISRHVVVVDVRGAGAETTSATVTDVTQSTSGGRVESPRAVKAPGIPLTRERLLEQITLKGNEAVSGFVAGLISTFTALGLETRATHATLHFGITNGGEFYSLVSLQADRLWSQLSTNLIGMLNSADVIQHKKRLNELARFFKPEELDEPTERDAQSPRYEDLMGRGNDLIETIRWLRNIVSTALERRE